MNILRFVEGESSRERDSRRDSVSEKAVNVKFGDSCCDVFVGDCFLLVSGCDGLDVGCELREEGLLKGM